MNDGINAPLMHLRNVVTKTGAYTAVNQDIILADTTGGNIVITLPSSHNSGDLIDVKNIGSGGYITISGNGCTIDGDANVYIQIPYEVLSLVSDGSNWHLI